MVDVKDSKLTGALKIVRAPFIALYSHKGGVGKTTTIQNLAAALSFQKKRVLLVDADPQCSLTSALAHIVLEATVPKPSVPANKQEKQNEKDAKRSGPLAPATSSSQPPTTGCGLPEPMEDSDVTLAREALKRIDDILLEFPISDPIEDDVEPFDFKAMDEELTKCSLERMLLRVFVGATEFESLVCATSPIRVSDHVNLIPGAGNRLYSDLENKMREPKELHHLGAFRRLLSIAAEKMKADIVLVDFGPSATPLNRLFVMSCDYILPNILADDKSTASMQMMLDAVLPKWYATRSKWQKMKPRDPVVVPFKFSPELPRLLPFLLTAFPVNEDGKTSDEAMRWLKAHRENIKKCSSSVVRQCYRPLAEDVSVEEAMVLEFAPETDEPLISFEATDKKDSIKDHFLAFSRALLDL